VLHPHTLDVKVTRAEHFSPAIPAESRLPMRLPRRPESRLGFVEAIGHAAVRAEDGGRRSIRSPRLRAALEMAVPQTSRARHESTYTESGADGRWVNFTRATACAIQTGLFHGDRPSPLPAAPPAHPGS